MARDTMAPMSATAPFFRPGGTMEPGSPSYIRRKSDGMLLDALLRREFVFVLDSRQKGKSSMVAQTIVELQKLGVRTVKLDLQRIGANVTPEQWYAGLLASIAAELGLHKELFASWAEQQSLGPLARWLYAIEHVALKHVSEPMVVFVDEVDFVRALHFSVDEFFAAIRDCFNRRSEGCGFERLTFCLVGVATPSQIVQNPEITPFNIGSRISISDFTLAETMQFAPKLTESGRDGEAIIRRAFYWLSGHPYLTQLVCSHIANDPVLRTRAHVDTVIRKLFLDPRSQHQEPNIADVERRLLESEVPGLNPAERRAQVLEMFGRLYSGKRIESSDESPITAVLRLSGVCIERGNRLVVRNRVYREVLNEAWRRKNLPDAEIRRQRGAARVAILRTALIAGAVVLAVVSGAINFWRLSDDRKLALDALTVRSRELSEVAQERQDALGELKLSNAELEAASRERESALTNLHAQNERLRILERERARALSELTARSDALERQTYSGLMALVRIDMAQSHWVRLPEWVDATSNSPYRGWEWGHVALLTNRSGREAKIPRRSLLDQLAGMTVAVTSSGELLSLETPSLKRIAGTRLPAQILARRSFGPYRLGLNTNNQGDGIYSVETGKELIRAEPSTWIADIDPVGHRFMIVQPSVLNVVELRSIKDGSIISTFKLGSETVDAKFLKDGTMLSIHGETDAGAGKIVRWGENGAVLNQTNIEEVWGTSLHLCPRGNRYAVSRANGHVELRDVKSHAVLSELKGPNQAIQTVVFNSDGSRVVTGGSDGIVRLFDSSKGVLIQSFAGHRGAIASAAFFKDGKRWATMDQEGYVRWWHTNMPKSLLEFKDHTRAVRQVYVTANGRYLVSGSLDGKIVSRDLTTGKVTTRTETKNQSAFISRAGMTNAVYWARRDGTLCKLNPKSLATEREAALYKRPFLFASVLADGKRIFTSSDRKFALVDADTLRIITRFEPKPIRKPISRTGAQIYDTFALSPDGRSIAVFFMDVGTVQIFETDTGQQIGEWTPADEVFRMAFLKDGKSLALTMLPDFRTITGKTVVCESLTGKKLFELEHEGRSMTWLDYAPATNMLAGLSADGSVFLWDMKSRMLRATFKPSPPISIFSFSPDGQRLISNAGDGGVRLWDTQLGREHLSLAYPGNLGKLGDSNWAGEARFTSDGRRVLLSSPDGYTRVWDSMPFH